MEKKYFSLVKRFLFAAVVAGCFMFSSCLDHDRYYDNVEAAGIALINAAPGSPDLDLIGDQQREQLPSKFAYDSAIAYLPAYPGYRVFGFAQKNAYNLIVSQQFFLHPTYAYSIFLADTLGAAKMFGFRDSLTLPDSGKANIRFVNMVPDSKGLTLVEGGKTIADNIAFGKASDFSAIDTAENYSFQIKESSGAATLATLSGIQIRKKGVYTVWARGFENSNIADSLKIGLKIMRNR